MSKLMIIDGSSLLYRAFFALPPLNNALGVPTNAVYGFLTMLTKLYDEIHPDYITVAFDKGKETFRTELYPDYKGNRPNAPDDLRPQFALIREVLEALGIKVIEEEGYEGDDIIGSLSKSLGNADTDVYIITGDRDSLQLVDEYSRVLLTKKGISDMLTVTPDTMKEIYGYGPELVIEMKSLMGDSSDNIPGVPGVGEKTALKLLNQFGSLEGVYDNLEAVSGKKLKERLTENKDLAFLSRELATIKTDMDLPYTLNDFVQHAHTTEFIPLFDKLGFHAVTPRLMRAMGLEESATHTGDSDSLFADFANPPEITWQEKEAFVPSFWQDKVISIAFEAAGTSPFWDPKVVFISNGDDVIRLGGDDANRETVLRACNEAKAVITTDSKMLLEMLGVTAPADIAIYTAALNTEDEAEAVRLYDVTLMAYLADPTRTNYGIGYLCERFEVPAVPDGGAMELAGTAVALQAMYGPAVHLLKEQQLWDLYKDVELPLVYTLAVMEKNGIYINPERLQALRQRFTEEVETLRQRIYEEAGETFNINSPKQLGHILFETLQLPVIKKTKTGFSTDAEVLDMLRAEHPIVEDILAYRTVAKLLSTYIDGLEDLINPDTKRIHTSFNQMVTATGRLSSSNPNLQNIPVRTEKGKEIRGLFLPGEGYDWLVSADYSQIELRVLAHLSEDPALIKAFNDGMDIHRFTAAEVLGKSPEEVTSEERSHAKAVNFGIIYGISDFGLSRDLGITREAAKNYISLYFSRYPKVKAYMDAMVAMAHETGTVRTMFGRLRALPDINSRNFNRRSFAERTAMNTPIQGTAADIIKLAMNKVEARLRDDGYTSRLLLQVHDELVLEVTNEEKDAVEALLKECMESVVQLAVPLIVDVHSATTWADVK